MIVNRITFSKMASVSRAAVTQGVRHGTLRTREDGLLDTDDEINSGYLAKKKGTSEKSVKIKQKKRVPKLEPFDGKISEAKIEKKEEIKTENNIQNNEILYDEEDMGMLAIAKMRAEIRFKNEQADSVLQKRLEKLGLLIDRELVTKAFSKLSTEIKTRLIELPQKIVPSLFALIKSGKKEIDIQKKLEDEIGRVLQEIKISAENF